MVAKLIRFVAINSSILPDIPMKGALFCVVVEPLMKRLQIWHHLEGKTVAIHALELQDDTVFLGHCHLFFTGI